MIQADSSSKELPPVKHTHISEHCKLFMMLIEK